MSEAPAFAVPSNIVKKIVGDLIDFGSVKRAKLGVSMSPVTQEIADKMKLSSLDGVYINEVLKGGAADKAGVKEGDILLSIDSTVIKSPAALQEKAIRADMTAGYSLGEVAALT